MVIAELRKLFSSIFKNYVSEVRRPIRIARTLIENCNFLSDIKQKDPWFGFRRAWHHPLNRGYYRNQNVSVGCISS